MGITYKNFDLSVLCKDRKMLILNTTDWAISLAKGTGNYYRWRVKDHWTPENTDAKCHVAPKVEVKIQSLPLTGFLMLGFCD